MFSLEVFVFTHIPSRVLNGRTEPEKFIRIVELSEQQALSTGLQFELWDDGLMHAPVLVRGLGYAVQIDDVRYTPGKEQTVPSAVAKTNSPPEISFDYVDD